MRVRPTRWRAPGRVNLIGEHTDYNDGFALPFAIQAGVVATVAPGDDGTLHLASAQEATSEHVGIDDLAPGSITGWAAYPAGVVWAVTEMLGEAAGPLRDGIDVSIDGDVPLGSGLSSSAAVVCSTVAALDELLGLDLPASELIALAREAENSFVGAPTGGMDQTASMLCEAEHALFIDARTMETRQVPLHVASAGLGILVTDSRVRHAHAAGGYRQRHAACVRAAEVLGVRALRDITVDGLGTALDAVADDELRRVTRHVVTENARVLETVALLELGRPEAIGPLLDASHDSLRDDFRASVPEVDAAVEAARSAGALGSRITGGGFGGCTITLARAGDLPAIREATTETYAARSYLPPRFWTVTPSMGAHKVT